MEEAQRHYRRLSERIDSMRLLQVNIEDDGNCLFRAISYQLVRDDGFFSIVRHIVVEHMEANREEYAVYIGHDEFSLYIEGMKQNKVWGDELCVHAAARALNCLIHVVTSSDQRWYLRYKPNSNEGTPQSAEKWRNLFLCYRAPDHYNCIVAPQDPAVPTVDLDRFFDRAASLLKKPSPAHGRVAQNTQPSTSTGQFPLPKTRPSPTDTASATASSTRTEEQHPKTSGIALQSRVNVAPLDSADPALRYLPSYGEGGSKGERSREAPARPSSSRGVHTIDTLQYHVIHQLQYPIVIRLCGTVRASNKTSQVAVCSDGSLMQHEEGAFFYLHPVSYDWVLSCGSRDYPWGAVGGAVRKRYEDSRKEGRTPMPLFFLQSVHSGAILRPGSEAITAAFPGDSIPSLRCLKAMCLSERSRPLAEALMTVEPLPHSISRTSFQLRFVNDNGMYCCLTVLASHPTVYVTQNFIGCTFSFHQLFNGRPERSCLKCRQWYDAAQRKKATSTDISPGGCAHESWVEAVQAERLDRL